MHRIYMVLANPTHESSPSNAGPPPFPPFIHQLKSTNSQTHHQNSLKRLCVLSAQAHTHVALSTQTYT